MLRCSHTEAHVTVSINDFPLFLFDVSSDVDLLDITVIRRFYYPLVFHFRRVNGHFKTSATPP